MFGRVLIANRGEIACRIAATLGRLGIHAIAVFSDADRDARHVRVADEAVRIGPPDAAESYLGVERILDAARRTGAEAIHPGYGFLAENAGFARACADAGLVFIGPPAGAMEAMGAKDRARAIVAEAGVPIVPGWDDDPGDDRAVERAARNLGLPLLVKAAAGGGGKGMRIVHDPADLAGAIAGARREAKAAFGDDRLLLERLIEHARHVEVQVFGDRFGHVVHLFERECSLQRRHQKVLEEAPAPGLNDTLRTALLDAAVRAASAAGYQNAGTVEFLLDREGKFYFIEMNARLQVEHPVTEAITGLDLVEWQLRIAAGKPLPLSQAHISARGHAIEARLYAEDPARGNLPSTGALAVLRLPDGEGIRIDTGVAEGDRITAHYDPMIAKLTAHGSDRETARRRLAHALDRALVAGPATNLDLLTRLVREPAFVAGKVDTGYLDRAPEALSAPACASDDDFLDGALCLLGRRIACAQARAAASVDPDSPWHRVDGWRLNDVAHQTLRLRAGDRTALIDARASGDGFVLQLDDQILDGRIRSGPDGWRLERAGRVRQVRGAITETGVVLLTPRGRIVIESVDPLLEAEPHEAAEGRLSAPMPGRIVRVLVEAGQHVRQGSALVVLEAMKMEHTLTAPADGRIAAVRASEGERVEEGVVLVDLEGA